MKKKRKTTSPWPYCSHWKWQCCFGLCTQRGLTGDEIWRTRECNHGRENMEDFRRHLACLQWYWSLDVLSWKSGKLHFHRWTNRIACHSSGVPHKVTKLFTLDLISLPVVNNRPTTHRSGVQFSLDKPARDWSNGCSGISKMQLYTLKSISSHQ